jgi:hypothetical protein
VTDIAELVKELRARNLPWCQASADLLEAQAKEIAELRSQLPCPVCEYSIAQPPKAMGTIDIVFDGPPGPEAGRFVEVERDGRSTCIGEWIERPDGCWALRINDPT